MGPERKPQLQSPSSVERTAQETTALITQSERLVAELDELLQRAKRLLEEQRALVQSFKDRKK